ncbi:MAG: PorP/SprF family type IX secretion system membrane protein [Bacteroidetes bacterium]|nr:PorP/SprF family type IX secretion system membrane protein [Bacteroidota bacterium]
MKKQITYIVCFLCFAAQYSVAQDVHFSQYYLSPLSLNPANTGNYSGDFRLFGNYREQWRSIKAYTTFSGGGDFNFYPRNRHFSAGILLVHDNSSENLTVNKILPSLAFHKKIAGWNVNIGAQPGIAMKSIGDFNSYTFPSQWNRDKAGFDRGLQNNEPNAGLQFIYFDMSAGASLSRKFGKWEPELGAAFFHLNRPQENFMGNDDTRLPIRHAYTAALTRYANDFFRIKVHSLYGYTSEASDWVSGINVEYILSKTLFFTNSLYAGFMWRDGFKRNPDAGIFTVGMNYAQYTIGFSYDVTFSQLKTSNSKGAFEIALIYRAKNTHLTQKILPCERY